MIAPAETQFQAIAGAGVDAVRVGPTGRTTAEKIEDDLVKLIPQKNWALFSHWLIWHGRRRCHAKKPACGACPLARLCPSFGTGPTDPVEAAALVTTQGPR